MHLSVLKCACTFRNAILKFKILCENLLNATSLAYLDRCMLRDPWTVRSLTLLVARGELLKSPQSTCLFTERLLASRNSSWPAALPMFWAFQIADMILCHCSQLDFSSRIDKIICALEASAGSDVSSHASSHSSSLSLWYHRNTASRNQNKSIGIFGCFLFARRLLACIPSVMTCDNAQVFSFQDCQILASLQTARIHKIVIIDRPFQVAAATASPQCIQQTFRARKKYMLRWARWWGSANNLVSLPEIQK